jgi:MFS family permease
MATDSVFEAEVARHYRRNFIVNALDLSVFMGGYAFMSASSVLPVFASRLTSSPLVIGLVAALPVVGWLLPQVFTAPWVERLPRKKPFVVLSSLFGERLSIIVLALLVWQTSALGPRLTLTLFLIVLTWHSFGAGIVATAWQDMIAKVIPVRARGRFFGLSFFGGSALGLAAAAAATVILARYPFPTNFAICFTITAVCLVISFLCLMATREPARYDPRPPQSVRAYGRGLLLLLQQDANYRRYLLSRLAWGWGTMGTGFIAVYAARRFQLPDQVAGTFTGILVASQMATNLVLGELADRRGHKLILEIATLGGVGAMAFAFFGSAPWWFYLSFALLGISLGGNSLSGLSITMEFSTPESRPTYIGLANTIYGIGTFIGPLLAGWIADRVGYPPLFALSLVGCILTFIILHWWVQEPRHLGGAERSRPLAR